MKVYFCIFVLITILIIFNYSFNVYKYLVYFLASIAGVLLAFHVNLSRLSQKDLKRPKIRSNKLVINSIESLINENYIPNTPEVDNYFKDHLLISRNVDSVIEEIVDYTLRDFIFWWYKDIVGQNGHDLNLQFKNEIWLILSRFLDRIRAIDGVKFLTKDIVNRLQKHYIEINSCIQNKDYSYQLSNHLETKEKEIDLLKKISSFLLNLVLPSHYANLKPFHNLLREILTLQVFDSAIDLITDPDYINQKILDHAKWYQLEMEKNRKTYAYAETYEDFIKLINRTCDLEVLRRLNYYIANEILQATALNNLKTENTKDGSFFNNSPQSNNKGELLLNRNLKRYINQLCYAKKQCEKRMRALGNIDVTEEDSQHHTPSPINYSAVKKVFKFKLIIKSDFCRNYFRKFLQSLTSSGVTASEKTSKYLIMFWECVEEMKKQEQLKQYKIANDLLNHSYFLNSLHNHFKLPKSSLKNMEAFVLGNKGPESFYEAQAQVSLVLEEKYYPLFIVSREYVHMVKKYELASRSGTISNREEALTQNVNACSSTISSQNDLSEASIIDEHLTKAKTRLESLQQKLTDKTQALSAMKKTNRETDDKNVNFNVNLKLVQLLAKEIEDIEKEIKYVKFHIQWSELWQQHLGSWKVEFHDLQIDNETPGASPIAVLIMQLDMCGKMSSSGWVLTRTVDEIIELKRKLVKIKPSLRKIEILRLKNINTNNQNLFIQGKQRIFELLTTILEDEYLYKTEDSYLFFCPSSETCRHSICYTKQSKSKLPFATWFGISKGSSENNDLSLLKHNDCDEELTDRLQILENFEEKANMKDDIAEPLYALASEIFDLSGATGWLRKTIIAFVHITFGHSINKQLFETVTYMFSESMIFLYLKTFRRSIWPGGILADQLPSRSEEIKKQTQKTTKMYLLNNIPDICNNLFGYQNTRKGISKIFDSLQDKQLNKQLIYELLEVFLLEIAPELEQTHQI